MRKLKLPQWKIPEFDIVKHQVWFFALSLIIILAGVVSVFVQGFNWDIDFTGGTQIEINMGKEFDNEKLATLIEETVEKPPVISKNEQAPTHAIIKTIPLDSSKRKDLYDAIAKEYTIKDMEKAVISSSNFSATIGKELQQKTILATMIATILILLYITIRFEFNVAVSGILALFHDVLVMIAVYTIFQVPMNSNFVATILTILGFSINDTIVIFDRIRYNLKKPHKGVTYAELANKSIWQTLGRCINTAFCVFISILFLWIFGVPSIKEFAFPLTIGVVAGSYSTIFLCIPISVWLHKKGKKA